MRPAVEELNDQYLFDGRLEVSAVGTHRKLGHSAQIGHSARIGLERGWYASRSPSVYDIKLREPRWEYPKALFAPLRESRRIIFENLPPTRGPEAVYNLLHDWNIIDTSLTLYHRASSGISGYQIKVDLETKDEADAVIESYDGWNVGGYHVKVSFCKLPLKYIGTSWDGGRGWSHNKSRRDEGSAVGTNFEEVTRDLRSTLWSYSRHALHVVQCLLT